MNDPEFLRLLAERVPSRNLARIARLIAAAKAGELDEEHIMAVFSDLREVQGAKLDTGEAERFAFLKGTLYPMYRPAFYQLRDADELVVAIPVRRDRVNPREIVTDYLDGLLRLLLGAMPEHGAH